MLLSDFAFLHQIHLGDTYETVRLTAHLINDIATIDLECNESKLVFNKALSIAGIQGRTYFVFKNNILKGASYSYCGGDFNLPFAHYSSNYIRPNVVDIFSSFTKGLSEKYGPRADSRLWLKDWYPETDDKLHHLHQLVRDVESYRGSSLWKSFGFLRTNDKVFSVMHNYLSNYAEKIPSAPTSNSPSIEWNESYYFMSDKNIWIIKVNSGYVIILLSKRGLDCGKIDGNTAFLHPDNKNYFSPLVVPLIFTDLSYVYYSQEEIDRFIELQLQNQSAKDAQHQRFLSEL